MNITKSIENIPTSSTTVFERRKAYRGKRTTGNQTIKQKFSK